MDVRSAAGSTAVCRCGFVSATLGEGTNTLKSCSVSSFSPSSFFKTTEVGTASAPSVSRSRSTQDLVTLSHLLFFAPLFSFLLGEAQGCTTFTPVALSIPVLDDASSVFTAPVFSTGLGNFGGNDIFPLRDALAVDDGGNPMEGGPLGIFPLFNFFNLSAAIRSFISSSLFSSSAFLASSSAAFFSSADLRSLISCNLVNISLASSPSIPMGNNEFKIAPSGTPALIIMN
mmetsp:Transcript_15275/g.26088  ORF Transcript_15275/g.26088 Transcript_15275/m.26088 type:complete len:230 (+) Transcript_15275:2325-3014(+)